MKNYAKMSFKGSSSSKVKTPKSPLGSSSRSSAPFGATDPAQKRSYSKSKGTAAEQFGKISFGNTGMDGES